MKGQMLKRILALGAVLCLAIGLTGCASTASLFASMTMNDVNQWSTNDKRYEQSQSDFGIEKMTEMASADGLTLYFNEKTTEVAVKTKDGSVWYSNPQDRTAFNQNKLGTYSSQLLVTTIGTTTETVTEENNFEESVQYEQFEVTKQDNGFSIEYLFGKKQNVPLYPQAMTVETFDKILATIEKTSDQHNFKTYYSLVDMETIDDPQTEAAITEKYLNAKSLGKLRVLKNSPSTLQKNRILGYLENAGFTMEDREKELTAVGYVDQEGVTNYYTVTMTYTLQNGRLVVDVPVDKIRTTGGVIIQGITVLPHWNTKGGIASTQMLLPDGSGAIVKLGETAASGTSVYQEKFYGRDFAQSQKTSTSEKKNLYFPMYGLSNKDGSMYATATGADATAYMMVNPCTSKTAPGYGGFYFQLVDTEQVRMSAEDTDTVTTYANEAIKDAIQVDFSFLGKDATSWVDIAKEYKARLESENKIADNELPEKMPVSVEFLGAIDDIKTVVGVPTEYIVPLTTFDQAKGIVDELSGLFSDNKLIVQYDAWVKGGVKAVIQDKVKTESKVGSVSDMQELADAVENANGAFYPLVDYQYIYRNKMFDGFTTTSGAARSILREAAYKADFNISNFMVDEDGFYGFVLSPEKSQDTLKSFLESYGKKLPKVKTVGLTYAASDLSGDYNRDNFKSRNVAKAEMDALLQEQAKDYGLLARGANEYALKSLDVATQLPMTSNAHPIIAYSVPFTQMVLSGDMVYTADVWNNEADSTFYTLKCIETGSAPDFTVIKEANDKVKYTKYDQYFAVTYDTIKDSMIEVTNTVTEALSDVYGAKMTGYDKLNDNVVAVTYDNGNGVIVNYGTAAFASSYGNVEGGSYLKFTTAKGGDAQ